MPIFSSHNHRLEVHLQEILIVMMMMNEWWEGGEWWGWAFWNFVWEPLKLKDCIWYMVYGIWYMGYGIWYIVGMYYSLTHHTCACLFVGMSWVGCGYAAEVGIEWQGEREGLGSHIRRSITLCMWLTRLWDRGYVASKLAAGTSHWSSSGGHNTRKRRGESSLKRQLLHDGQIHFALSSVYSSG